MRGRIRSTASPQPTLSRIRKLEEEKKEKVARGLTFHGLLHTIGALSKEGSESEEDITIALGRKTIAMVWHFSQKADHRIRVTAATPAFDPINRNKAGA